MSRTYVRGGHYYARGYRGYYYHGYAYYHYAPAYWYGPHYYGWAYNPWAAPVVYGWGWGAAPWYGYYGYYFNPYPVYASASFWLTDYLIAQNLQAAYEARAEANAAAQAEVPAEYSGGGGGSNAVVLTPEIKQAIADEVKAQLAAEKEAAAASGQNAAATSGNEEKAPAALDPTYRTFIVATTLSEQTDDGTECSLSSGDILTRISDDPDADQNVKVIVSGSQKNDCASGSQLAVSVQDLQDMHNHFREQIDDGLQSLADNQGKNGLPAAPPANRREDPDAKAEPDQQAAAELQKQEQDADQAESDVQSAAQAGGSQDD
ncbi:MAG: hypothetical protein WBP79_11735 [Candidatus Acidiferrales bacterium]